MKSLSKVSKQHGLMMLLFMMKNLLLLNNLGMQRKRWAQGQFDVAHRFIPKMLKEGIRRHDIRILDGCLHLLQPHFLLISTFFVILSYVQMAIGQPLFTEYIYQFIHLAYLQ